MENKKTINNLIQTSKCLLNLLLKLITKLITKLISNKFLNVYWRVLKQANPASKY